MNALTIKQVVAKVALGQSTIYRMIARGEFPKPFSLVGNRTAWLESEVDAWLRQQSGLSIESSTPAAARDVLDTSRLDELARRIAMRITPQALWDLADVAEYLHRSEQHTRQWIITLDGFPRPARIPSGKAAARVHALWRAKDVIAWAESFIEM